MSLGDLELRAGDVIRASGALLVDEDGVWLQRDVIVPAIAAGPGQSSPLRHLSQAVSVRGDVAAAWRPLPTAGLAGFVELTGRWNGDGLQVIAVHSQDNSPLRAPPDIEPPCPAPAGGWPVRRDALPSVPSDLPGVVGAWMAWASTDHPVMVVATSQPDVAEHRLRPDFDGSLCVVASPWSGEELERVTASLHTGAVAPVLLQVGTTLAAEGRVRLVVDVVRVTPELVDLVGLAPEGMMEVLPWLLRADA